MDYLLYYQLDNNQAINYVSNELAFLASKKSLWESRWRVHNVQKPEPCATRLNLIFVTIPEIGQFKGMFQWYNNKFREIMK